MSLISSDFSHISSVGGMLFSSLIGRSGLVRPILIFFLPGSGIRTPLFSGTPPLLLAIFISASFLTRASGIDNSTLLSFSLSLGN